MSQSIDRSGTSADASSIQRPFTDEIITLLGQLIDAPSVTGHEDVAQELLVDWARRHDLDVRLEHCTPELLAAMPALHHEQRIDARANVIITFPAGAPIANAPVILNGHIDVVAANEPEWRTNPFASQIIDGRMYGRGTTDMKGGVASALGALRILQESGTALPFDVRAEIVIGEESGGLGTLTRIAADEPVFAVVNLEPTAARVAAACGGCLMIRVEVEGRAAHTSVPHEGVSALDKLILIRAHLIEFFDRRRASVDHPLFHELRDPLPGLVSVLKSGVWSATVPDAGFLEARIGVLPGETIQECLAAFRQAVDSVVEADDWLAAHPPQVTMMHEGFPSWETPITHPLVAALSAGASSANLNPSPTAVTFGNDGSHYAGRGVPTIVFGPGDIREAHQPNESVEVNQVVDAAHAIAYGLINLGERSSGSPT
ncbi:M20 family metallopeptidase [Microbacterium sp. A93]|uniref:M20 family metallopeptidase n=1 Tax=Microbacterium sp. A93 TaxID=3450716 RepID=UPI003F43E482